MQSRMTFPYEKINETGIDRLWGKEFYQKLLQSYLRDQLSELIHENDI